MLFWISAALMTLGACLAVLLPAVRARRSAPADNEYDLAVYRDQLAELDRDVGRGLIAPDEAGQARAEIGRRMLRLDGDASTGSGVSRLASVIATVAVLAVPVASWGLYAATGSPDLPAQPLASRLNKNPADSSIDELVARAEAHLRANPQDGRGWAVLAPIYHRMGRWSEAVVAYRNAIRLNGGGDARLETGLGEALAGQAGGMIGTDAQAAFERALVIEPDNPRARFLLAAAFAQEGRTGEAAEALGALQRSLPPDSPWRQPVAQALADLGPNAGPPSADADQAEMIEQMVAGLDQRLRSGPGELEDWQRLIRSYIVLGRRDAAADALARGTDALAPDAEASAALAAFARANGLEGTE